MAYHYPLLTADVPLGAHGYTVDLAAYAPRLVPPPATALPAFDPSDYFRTSGDAIAKADEVIVDLANYLATVDAACRLSPSEAGDIFRSSVVESLSALHQLRNDLRRVREGHIFLETDRLSDGLVVVPKDPRIVSSKKAEDSLPLAA